MSDSAQGISPATQTLMSSNRVSTARTGAININSLVKNSSIIKHQVNYENAPITFKIKAAPTSVSYGG